MSITLKKTIVTLFLVYLLCTTFTSHTWFFHYNSPTQEFNEESKEVPEILATIVLIDFKEQKNTNNYIEQLKTALQEKFKDINIIIAHTGSMQETKIEIPTIANKPNVDLVLSVRVVCCQQQKPSLHLYRYSWGQEFISKINEMAFYSLEDAYLFSKEATRSWASCATQQLMEKRLDLFDIKGTFACPYKILAGIKKPSLACELCLNTNSQISIFIDSLVEIIELIIKPLIKQRNRTTEL